MESTYTVYESSSTVDEGILGALFILFSLFYLVVLVVTIVSLWRLFAKANRPGWASIVPIYNTIVMLQIAGRPIWWLLLLFVPFLNVWISIVMYIDFAKSYGKSLGYGILAALVPIVGLPVLAFSKNNNYVGPAAEGYEGLMPAPDKVVSPVGTTAEGQPVPPASPVSAGTASNTPPNVPPQV